MHIRSIACLIISFSYSVVAHIPWSRFEYLQGPVNSIVCFFPGHQIHAKVHSRHAQAIRELRMSVSNNIGQSEYVPGFCYLAKRRLKPFYWLLFFYTSKIDTRLRCRSSLAGPLHWKQNTCPVDDVSSYQALVLFLAILNNMTWIWWLTPHAHNPQRRRGIISKMLKAHERHPRG